MNHLHLSLASIRRLLCALVVALWVAAASTLAGAQESSSDAADPSRPGGPQDPRNAATRIRRRPNIIVILSDDHRYDFFGSMGHSFIQTPHLDRLADEGVRFTNAFVTTSLCSPSRASFLTGQYAHTHGVQNNFTPWNPENRTFMEDLADAGYAGAFIGKWHMPGGLPNLDNLDEFVTFTVQDGQGRYFNCPLIVNGEEQPSRVPYLTTELTNRAIEFVEARRDEPFVIYLSHKAAHANFLPPPELEDLYDDADVHLPDDAHPFIQASKGQMVHGILQPIPDIVRSYAETITAMDAEIGRLLDTLDDLDLTDDTMVVYTSDNGYMWGEHGLVDKRWAYETSIRIPFLVRYPPLTGDVPDSGGAAGNGADGAGEGALPRELPQAVLNIDLAPTLLELAGVAPSREMHGESWLGYLREPDRPGREAFLYEYYLDFPFPVPPIRAVRTPRYKLIDYDSRRRDQLFDLEADPAEERNLLRHESPPGLEERLRDRLDELQPGGGE